MSIQKPRKPLTEEQKARRKEYKKAWNAANKEKVAAYNREWIEKNPDRARESRRLWAVKNPEKISEKDSKYRANNAEKLRELSKTNYEKNKEALSLYYQERYVFHRDEILERNAAWRSANPEKARLFCINRRARLRAQNGKLSSGIIDRLMELQRGKCIVCKVCIRKSGHHLDHIEPLSKGGVNSDENMQLLCPTCNRKKSSKDPIKFMQSHGLLL